MQVERDLKFEAELVRRMAEAEFSERTGTHITDLCYCLNKQALRRLNPLPTTRHEILLYSMGWATQRWLTGKSTDEDEIEVDGIKVTLDAFVAHPWELKCSFQSNAKPVQENTAWVHQILAQCYVKKDTIAWLSRFELMGDWKHEKPTLSAWRFEFTQEELDDNWEWAKSRRDLFEEILETKKLLPANLALPVGQTWECKYCKPEYKEFCCA